VRPSSADPFSLDVLEADFGPACEEPRRREARFLLIGLFPGSPSSAQNRTQPL
jgi:hypothetical protein